MEKFVRIGGEDYPAGFQNIAPVCDRESHLRILLHKEDSNAGLVQLLYYVEYLVDQYRCEAHGGLVKHHELGAGHESSTHGKHLLLAAGESTRDLFAALLKAGKTLIDVLYGSVDRIIGLCKSAHFQVFLNAHAGEYPPPLRNVRYAHLDDLVRRCRLQIMILK